MAADVIQYLLGVVKINDAIEGQTLRYAIDMVKTGQGAALSGLDDDCICITHRSKPIKAKTVGQKQYVDAIAKNYRDPGRGPCRNRQDLSCGCHGGKGAARQGGQPHHSDPPGH